MSLVIAIDGPAASGKGTIARRVAKEFGFAYLDTGLLYRATGMKVVEQGGNPEDEKQAHAAALALTPEDLENEDLRLDKAAVAASKVASIQSVRAALLDFQRNLAANPPAGASGAVLDGRDIGTVVCPDADVKLFITASTEVRAERRLKELQGKGQDVIYAQVLKDMIERDKRDSERATAPLKPADDAIMVDTSEMDVETVMQKVTEIISRKA